MKKSCILWMFAVLMLAVGISSCSKSDSEEIANEEPVNEEVTNNDLLSNEGVDADTYQRLSVFFQSELHDPFYNEFGVASSTFFGELEWDAQPCYLINSMEEFRAVYQGNKQLPEVDFTRYSVLVGRTYRIDGSESLRSFSLVDEGDHYLMAIVILRNINPNYGYTCDIGDLFYWNIYPKLETKPITIERSKIEEVVEYE